MASLPDPLAVSTCPPPSPVAGSKTVGASSSTFGLRRRPGAFCDRRTIGASSSISFQPGSAAAGFRMKWSSQISCSTRSGVVPAASSTWRRPERETMAASRMTSA
ncbi:hypothetical protein ACFFX0_02800 [Citricoccus parietis]|uniref:Uncharacterized protein n=1 Tax=Citricoccus parietis TaxID=592307 RepID=A0ABV5FU12_9MICC